MNTCTSNMGLMKTCTKAPKNQVIFLLKCLLLWLQYKFDIIENENLLCIIYVGGQSLMLNLTFISKFLQIL